MKALLNFSCRIISKILSGHTVDVEVIKSMLERSSVGHPVTTDDLLKIMHAYEERENTK